MSSRSFRRRNSRRRRRQGVDGAGTPDAGPGAEGSGPAPEGGAGEKARTSTPGSPASRAAGRPAGSKPQGGRPSGGRPQGGRPSQPEAGRPQGENPREAPVRPEPTVPIVLPDCPVCGKPVRELASALTHRVSRKPAHFDCVVRELRESNEIAPQEKICYLGGGSFGILEFRTPGGSARFAIKKRIQYEEKEAPQDWKKPLQVPW